MLCITYYCNRNGQEAQQIYTIINFTTVTTATSAPAKPHLISLHLILRRKVNNGGNQRAILTEQCVKSTLKTALFSQSRPLHCIFSLALSHRKRPLLTYSTAIIMIVTLWQPPRRHERISCICSCRIYA